MPSRVKEPFLINPMKSSGKRRRRANPLPSGLLSRMVRKYGAKRGMKKAWEEYRATSGVRKRRSPRKNYWPGHKAEHRTASLKGWRKRKRSTSGYARITGARFPKSNPLGEEALLVGLNPGKGGKAMAVRRKRRKARKSARRRSSLVLRSNPRRRRSRKRVARRRSNPVARYYRRRSPARGRRRYRRNPAGSMALGGFGGGISVSKPLTLVMPIAVGLAARIATLRVPAMVGITGTLPKYGAQAAVAVGGGMLLNKFVGRTNATVWTIVSGVTILEGILNDFVFKQAVATAGIGAFPELQGVGEGDTDYGYDVGAYPTGESVNY